MLSKTFKNILIVRTDRIGDVILTTPAIKALRTAYPQSKLSLLVSALTVDLVSQNPLLNESIVDDRQGIHRGILGFWRLVYTLKKNAYDLAIIFHTKRRTNLACFLAGIPCRLGYRDKNYGFLLTHAIKDNRFLGEKHESQYCLDLLQHLGISTSGLSLHLSLHDDAETWAQDFFKEQSIDSKEILIAIHPGASDPAKCWGKENFVALIKKIYSQYQSKLVLIGSSQTKDTSNYISGASRLPVLNLTGRTSLRQLISLLKRCSLLISNDSGPVHMASALKVPVISIFTRDQPGINPTRWRPLGEAAYAVFADVKTEEILRLVRGVVERSQAKA